MRAFALQFALAVCLALGGASVTAAGTAHPPIASTHHAMGTEFTITVYARDTDADPHVLGPLLDEIFEEIDRIEDLITTWRPDSQVMHVNRNAHAAPVRVSADVIQLLVAAQQYSVQTGGAFDCTIGPLSRLYGLFGDTRQPSAAQIDAVLDSVGMHRVRLDRSELTVAFDRPGMELDFGAIGKGFAVDRAVEMLRRHGVTRALVDAGSSSIYALGAPPGERGWTVRVRDPYNPDQALAEFVLADESLSTSGCYDLDVVDGEPICNIFDPRTGRPRRGMLSASAIAPTATQSDALSTGFLVMGVEETRAFRKLHPEIEAVLVPESPDGEPAPIWIGDGDAPLDHGSEK